ncbi:MAG: ABC transporter permease [Solirubrobacteraceae bacterium]
MIRTALKGIVARRTRTVLTGLSIVLGVAMIAGAMTLSDTMRHAANSLTSASYKGTDAVVSARTAFDTTELETATKPTVPATQLATVRSLPQVGVAVGDLTNGETKIVDKQGKVLGGGPYFGVGFDASTAGAARLTPFRLKSGRFARAPGEVVIDAGTAASQHVAVGGHVRIRARGPVQSFRVSGIATFGGVKSIGTATFAVFDLQSAQRLFGEAGRYDSILVAARPGVSPTQLRSSLAAALPQSSRVQSAQTQDRFTLSGLKHFISIIEIALLVFGGVAVFVGAFTISNTLSITVAQRTRELAMLRTVGASRRQVLGSVVLEAFVVGVAASVVGLFAGLGLAIGLSSILASAGVELPQAGTVFAAHTVIAALAVGIIVTVLAGLAPAARATRVAPVTALREGATSTESAGSARTSRAARAIGVSALVLLLAGMFAPGMAVGSRFLLIGPGCVLLFVGVAMLSRRVAVPLASLLGRPAQRLGGPAGRLARGNAMRNPARTSSTAAALMIGVALVVFVAIIAQGLKQSTTGTLERQIRADYVVASSEAQAPLDPAAGQAVARAAGVTATSSIAQDEAKAFGKRVVVNGVQPATIASAYRYDWQSGSDASLAALDGDGAVVDKAFASEHRLRVGGRFAATTATGEQLSLVVRAIDTPPKWGALGLGPITLSERAFATAFPRARDRLTFVKVDGGAHPAAQSAIAHSLAGFPDAKVSTPAAFAKQQMSWVSQLLAIFYLLLALTVIISLLGIVNTLVLSVMERTPELGMLRAVGMTRRQLRRMVRHESIITALMGATLGIAVGLFLAALVTSALHGQGLQFAVPIGSLVAFVVVAVIAGMIAAIAPARRAARMDPLAALSYE